MNVEFEVEGFLQKLSEAENLVNKNLGKAVADCCMKVQRTAQEGMTNTTIDYSKIYYTHNKSIGHSPSNAGDYPAIDTGTLRRSISFSIEENGGQVIGKVGSTIKNPAYPLFLEYGTSKMKPRPWLRPSLNDNMEWIKERIKKAVREGVK